jgi:hypothetical protein
MRRPYRVTLCRVRPLRGVADPVARYPRPVTFLLAP